MAGHNYAIGGFVMQRKYTNIKDFEKELLEYLNQKHALREREKSMVSHIKKCGISKQDTIKINAKLQQE